MVATRSGSFPFLNLAQDFGVAYGDVLRLADTWRMSQAGEVTFERARAAAAAGCRILEAIGADCAHTLVEKILERSRWAP